METQGFAAQKNTVECSKCEQRERVNMRTKYVHVGADGWPVEGFIGKPFKTWLRRFILTKKVVRYDEWLRDGGCKIDFT